MKAIIFLSAIVAILPSVSAHYSFWALVINGTVTGSYQYVRYPNRTRISHRDPAYLKDAPMNLNCRTASPEFAGNTSTAMVRAGVDDVGFQSATNPSKYRPWQPWPIFHPGPLNVYLSKAPTGKAAEYDGNGKWFKIHTLGLNESVPENQTQQWYPMEKTIHTFRIPDKTPPGQYLLRIEHIYGGDEDNVPQLFMNCAQIDIRGPGGGTPSPMKHVTEWLNDENSELMWSTSMRYGSSRDPDWQIPGPAVWTGEEKGDEEDEEDD